jgi:hypothetical protein
MSRPASQSWYRAEGKRLAGRVGSIELLGGVGIEWRLLALGGDTLGSPEPYLMLVGIDGDVE